MNQVWKLFPLAPFAASIFAIHPPIRNTMSSLHRNILLRVTVIPGRARGTMGLGLWAARDRRRGTSPVPGSRLPGILRPRPRKCSCGRDLRFRVGKRGDHGEAGSGKCGKSLGCGIPSVVHHHGCPNPPVRSSSRHAHDVLADIAISLLMAEIWRRHGRLW